MSEIDLEILSGGIIAVPVLDTTTGQRIASGKCTLAGWSLRATATLQPQDASGNQVSPAAGTTIVGIPLPAGTYTVEWEVEVSGTTGAPEVNNFQLTQGGAQLLQSENGSAAGQPYPQPNATVQLSAASTTIAVKNIALATVGATYTAQLVITQVADAATAEITSGSNPVAEIALPVGVSDTHTFGNAGIGVYSDLTLVVLSGSIRGAVYVRLELPNTPGYLWSSHERSRHRSTRNRHRGMHRRGYRLDQGFAAQSRRREPYRQELG